MNGANAAVGGAPSFVVFRARVAGPFFDWANHAPIVVKIDNNENVIDFVECLERSLA